MQSIAMNPGCQSIKRRRVPDRKKGAGACSNRELAPALWGVCRVEPQINEEGELCPYCKTCILCREKIFRLIAPNRRRCAKNAKKKKCAKKKKK